MNALALPFLLLSAAASAAPAPVPKKAAAPKPAEKPAAAPDLRVVARAAAEEKFGRADKDASGFLDAAERAADMAAQPQAADPAKVPAPSADAADADKDKKLSKAEYLAWAGKAEGPAEGAAGTFTLANKGRSSVLAAYLSGAGHACRDAAWTGTLAPGAEAKIAVPLGCAIRSAQLWDDKGANPTHRPPWKKQVACLELGACRVVVADGKTS